MVLSYLEQNLGRPDRGFLRNLLPVAEDLAGIGDAHLFLENVLRQ